MREERSPTLESPRATETPREERRPFVRPQVSELGKLTTLTLISGGF